jgi:hypothetical protein
MPSVTTVLAPVLLLLAGRPLWLPPEAAILPERVHRACPECDDVGFAPCGDEGIGFGRRFLGHFFAGQPAAGYLVTHVVAPDTFLEGMRATPYDGLVASHVRAFAGARLIGVRREGYEVRVEAPQSVEVDIARGLHACVQESAKPVCCCCAGCAEKECCEKSLGSASVTVRFRDPLRPGRSLEYRFAPLGGGRSLLYERTASGKRIEVRFCQDWPGELAIERSRP